MILTKKKKAFNVVKKLTKREGRNRKNVRTKKYMFYKR